MEKKIGEPFVFLFLYFEHFSLWFQSFRFVFLMWKHDFTAFMQFDSIAAKVRFLGNTWSLWKLCAINICELSSCQRALCCFHRATELYTRLLFLVFISLSPPLTAFFYFQTSQEKYKILLGIYSFVFLCKCHMYIQSLMVFVQT